MPNIARTLSREARWKRYLFAIAAAIVGITVKLAIDGVLHQTLIPYLPAFASIMISAVLTGFGGGVVTTIIVTAWVFVSMQGPVEPAVQPNSFEIGFRCAILFGEGLLLSAGFERFSRKARSSASSELWHRKLLATASEGIWLVGCDNKICFANDRIAEMLACTVEELAGADWMQFIFHEDMPFESLRHQSSPSLRAAKFDRRMRRKDGSELWVLASVSPFHDESEEITGYLAMMTDITERKAAEMALRQSESRFRGLFENVLEGVYQTTPAGEILSANPMLLRMLGFEHEKDLLGSAIDLYVDPAQRMRNLQILENDGVLVNSEFELRRRDGTHIHVLENARAIRDEKGKLLCFEGTLLDITSKMYSDRQAMLAMQLEAASIVSIRMSHDFENLLTIMAGHARLAQSAMEQMHPAGAHLQQLLRCQSEAASLAKRLRLCSSKPEADVDRAPDRMADSAELASSMSLIH